MADNENTSIVCGVSIWPLLPSNDTASFINDVIICVINVPFCIFAFLANLVVIIAVIKTPSLQRPSNILLCGLAITDCLTGLVAQPLFVAWSVMAHRIHESCHSRSALLRSYIWCQIILAGWSLANIALISFDRHFALAKPLKYRVSVSKKDSALASFAVGTAWMAVVALHLAHFVSGLAVVVSMCLIVATVINHVGIVVAIRRHNNQMVDITSAMNASILLRREKKAFYDMLIVIAVLALCVVPAVAESFLTGVSENFEPSFIWSINLIYINSSLNPIIYFVRKFEIRSAVKTMVRF